MLKYSDVLQSDNARMFPMKFKTKIRINYGSQQNRVVKVINAISKIN